MLERLSMESTLVKGFNVSFSRGKCLLNPSNVTVEAYKPGGFKKGVVEALALSFPPSKATYFRDWNAVTIKAFNRLIGVYESGKVTFCASGDEEVEKILDYVNHIIESTSNEIAEKGVPRVEDVESWSRLTPLDLYKHLPKTNCRECGEDTCIALAAKVLSGEKPLKDCKPLSKPENRRLLEEFRRRLGDKALKALGWE
ncbi:MAG: (Fe-S)-binding protein [Candidatus Bathyarchaeia archaeon]